MAERTAAHSTIRHALAAGVAVACFGGTALAANSSSIMCDETTESLDDPVAQEITARPAAHDQDLDRHAEALINDAFADAGDDELVADPAESDTEVAEPKVTVAVPGVSSEQIRLYRDQMYRTDI